MRGARHNLAGHTGRGDDLLRHGTVHRQRQDAEIGALHGGPDAHAAARAVDAALRILAGRPDHVQADVRERQSLSHPVRGVQLGGGHQLLQPREQLLGDGSPRGEHEAHARQGVPLGGGELVSGGQHVLDRRRGREHGGRSNGHGGLSQGLCREGLGARDVHVRGHGRRTQRGAQQGERREAGHQTGSGAQPVGVPDGVPHPGHLAVGVDHALGRAGGAGGEEHGGLGVRVHGGDLGGVHARDRIHELRHGVLHAEQLLGDGVQGVRGDAPSRPPEGTGTHECLADAHEPLRGGALQRAGEPLAPEPLVRDHDHGADAQARVDQRGEHGARGNHEVHTVARAYAGAQQGHGEPVHGGGQLRPRDAALDVQLGRGAVHGPGHRAHVHHGWGVVVAAGFQLREEGDERGPATGAAVTVGLDHGVDAAEALVQPGQNRCGDVPCLGHQVLGALVAVDVRVGRAVHEVLEVALLEHRVPGAPQQQGGDLAGAHPTRDPLVRRVGRVLRWCGDVGDEVRDALAALTGRVGRLVRLPDVLGRRGIAQGERGVQERGGTSGHGPVHGLVQGQSQRGGDRLGVVVVHGGVGHDGRGVDLGVLLGPALRDQTAPVVREGDHGQPGGVEADLPGEVAEVRHSVLEAAEEPGALGEAHVQLVHGHHAPGPLGLGGGPDDVAPQVGPCGVAVHGEDDALGRAPGGGEGLSVVEQVPAALAAGHRLHRGGGGHGDHAGPRGVHTGEGSLRERQPGGVVGAGGGGGGHACGSVL